MPDRIDRGFLYPNKRLPQGANMVVTTRIGGFSKPPFAGLNLSDRVGDETAAVQKNRRYLRRALNLPTEPVWPKQRHGADVFVADSAAANPVADATIAFAPGLVCAVTAADCLPILLCDKRARRVAAIHAGWRGLAAGVIERTAEALRARPHDVIAWLGPAIGPDAFRVGDEVRDVFVADDKRAALAFVPDNAGRWMANIYQLARLRLERLGIADISGGFHCTYHDSKHFYSYRRSARTGRMAALVWIDARGG